MKKIYFLLLAIVFLWNCSNDEFNDVDNATHQTTKSVSGKVFKAEKIVDGSDLFLPSSYTKNVMATDNKGNLYFIQQYDKYAYSPHIKKYDLQAGEITTIARLGNNISDGYGICVDSGQNIYVTTTSGKVFFITQNGIVEDITSRFPTESDYPIFFGVCANNAGVVYVYVYDHEAGQKVYRISNKIKATLITSAISNDLFDFKGSGLFKSAGVHLYGVQSYHPEKYIMVDSRNGSIQYKTSRFPITSLTADPTTTKVYALDKQSIYHMRPTVNSDVLIGTIPAELGLVQSSWGEYYETPSIICTVPGAKLFYALIGERIFKLTL